jgi:DNA polymerase-3 subunit delta
MEQNYNDVLKDIKSGDIKKVYYLIGEENYFIDKITHIFEKDLLTKEEKDFNLVVYYGKEIVNNEVVSQCLQYPGMFGNRRIIIVKEAQNIKKWDDYTSYLSKPIPSTTLVFAVKGTGMIKTSKLYKSLVSNKDICVFNSARLKTLDTAKYISSQLKDSNRGIDLETASFFAETQNNDLELINRAIEKMVTATNDGYKLTQKDIEKHVSQDKKYTPFELNKAVGSKNHLVLPDMINYFTENIGEFKFFIIGQLFSYFSKALMLQSGVNPMDIGIKSSYIEQEYRVMATKYGNRLQEVLFILEEFDLKLKGVNASASDQELFKEMMYRIIL